MSGSSQFSLKPGLENFELKYQAPKSYFLEQCYINPGRNTNNNRYDVLNAYICDKHIAIFSSNSIQCLAYVIGK